MSVLKAEIGTEGSCADRRPPDRRQPVEPKAHSTGSVSNRVGSRSRRHACLNAASHNVPSLAVSSVVSVLLSVDSFGGKTIQLRRKKTNNFYQIRYW